MRAPLFLAATLVALGVPAAAAAQAADVEHQAGLTGLSRPVAGHQAPTSPGAAERADTLEAAGRPQTPAETAAPRQEGSGFGRFMRDVGGDYKHFFSKETAYWYSGGLAAAGLVHVADEDIAVEMAEPSATTRALEGGDKYGNMSFQVPLAVGWWIIGHADALPVRKETVGHRRVVALRVGHTARKRVTTGRLRHRDFAGGPAAFQPAKDPDGLVDQGT